MCQSPLLGKVSHCIMRKFTIIREERVDSTTHTKPVGTLILNDNLREGVVYLNHLSEQYKLVPVKTT